MKIIQYQIIIYLFVILNSCSTTKKLFYVPFDQDGSLDSIPDDFPKKPQAKSFLFRDKTKEYGLQNIKGNNLNIIDLNGDNYSDIVVIPSFYGVPEFYYFNIEKGVFEKGSSPFEETPRASFLLFYDINGDRVLDAISAVLNQESELSREPIRVFLGTRTKKKSLIFKENFVFKAPTPNTTLNLIDYNLDGKLDFFVGNWFKKGKYGPQAVPDQLFIQKSKKKKITFENMSKLLVDEDKKNITKMMFVNAAPTYGAQVCDLDQNGFPDIVTASTNKFQNKLWMNKYKFREKYRYFQNYGVASSVAGDADGLLNQQGSGRTFAVACADYNNDGIMDLYLGELTHNFDNEGVDKSSLLTGKSLKFPPKFYRTEYFLDEDDPNWHQADRRGIWVDLNNDGLLDLIIDDSGYPPYSKLIVFMQEVDHSFTNKSSEFGLDLLNPGSTVIADFNKDGKMDILTAQSNIRDDSISTRLYLFENQLDTGSHRSIRFFPKGQKANTQGLNSTLILKVKNAEGKFSTRRQNVSYSYGALPPQNEKGIHFGLATGEEVISVKVRWPYSTKIEALRTNLEKTYMLSNDFIDFKNITLCEDGTHFDGRKECKEF